MPTTTKPGMLTPEQLAQHPGLVRAYRNLHFRTEVMYSVKTRRPEKLIAYTPGLFLADVTFSIKEGERRRAVLNHERNVHAFADGYVTDGSTVNATWHLALYHPFKYETFVDVATEAPLYVASFVHLGPAGLHYVP